MPDYLIAIYGLTLTIIAINDLCKYKIPNVLLGILLCVYFLNWFLNPDLYSLQEFLTIFIVGNALMILLSAFKFIGAGDGKFIVIVLLISGYAELTKILILIGLLGGAISLLWLILGSSSGSVIYYYLSKKNLMNKIPKCIKKIDLKKIPYGVAISTAVLFTLV
jgi:Flp pilus assembly protein protease CpaA